MSFQDELNKNSKTPAEVDEELRKTMDTKAYLQYHKIKEYMLSKAKQGEFSVIGDKKRIILYHELYYDLAGLVKENNVPVRQPTGFLNLKTRTVIKKRIVVDESKGKEYEYFTESIRQLGMKDGMEIVPVIYSQSEDIEYPIPTPVIGIYIVGYKFCLKCTMVY